MTVDTIFPADFVKAVLGLILVIVLDLALGIAVAIKQKKFEFNKLADFYRTSIIPVVFGWAVADIVLRIAAFYQLPIVEQLEPLATTALYAVAMAALLAQVGSKLLDLRGDVSKTSEVYSDVVSDKKQG